MKEKKIRKILIANRGEIAQRIHRSASEMGIRTVAIFSDADRCAPFVLSADEAYPLTGNTSKETYLDIDKIISIARQSGCDAIHPGYGFLSENPEFAQATMEAGMIFVGPSHSAMKAMGSKTSARELMSLAKVSIVPGNTADLNNYHEALNVARSIGYPVLIKAVHGGGGKGMRTVTREDELEELFKQAKSESLNAFGSSSVFLEKYLPHPRHIEIQILADEHGNVIYLGERECSIQRRHQKVIEECPSSALTPELRKKMGEAAVDAARQCGYTNAGTVEFLLDADNSFYFLEMNTRLQVEHPVTEMVFGIDLVKSQIKIAQGEKLSVAQESVIARGHAIECRIYAEDPMNGFLPSTGTIAEYAPSEGYGIRNDSGVVAGSVITHYYDPMLAKLIAWGSDRREAILRMRRALREYKISGVSTTIPFCSFVVSHQQFVEGNYDINFVEKYFTPESIALTEEESLLAAFAAAALHNSGDLKGVSSDNKTNAGKWKNRRFQDF